MQQLYHFAQLKRTGQFRKNDHWVQKFNQKYYGITQPPLYNLSHVTVPFTILYSKSDESANFIDVEYLSTQLPRVQNFYQIPSDDFKHIDFIYSRFVRKLLNDIIITFLNASKINNWKWLKKINWIELIFIFEISKIINIYWIHILLCISIC